MAAAAATALVGKSGEQEGSEREKGNRMVVALVVLAIVAKRTNDSILFDCSK